MKRSIVLGWTGLCLAMALPALADERADRSADMSVEARAEEARPAVAPPGQCAEPRSASDARGGDGFSVVGPVAALFDPIDVAAGPGIEGDSSLRPPMPTARPMARPGACDQPGSGCSASSPSGIVIEPPVGGGNLPPQDPS